MRRLCLMKQLMPLAPAFACLRFHLCGHTIYMYICMYVYKFSHAPAFAGSCAYGAQVTLTAALRLVEASPATAMSYLTVVWGLVLGYFFFSEVQCLIQYAIVQWCFGLRNALKCFAVLSILKPVSADMISKSADYDSCRKTLVASAPDSLVKADSPDGCDACS